MDHGRPRLKPLSAKAQLTKDLQGIMIAALRKGPITVSMRAFHSITGKEKMVVEVDNGRKQMTLRLAEEDEAMPVYSEILPPETDAEQAKRIHQAARAKRKPPQPSDPTLMWKQFLDACTGTPGNPASSSMYYEAPKSRERPEGKPWQHGDNSTQ